jgi:hypothetical protein
MEPRVACPVELREGITFSTTRLFLWVSNVVACFLPLSRPSVSPTAREGALLFHNLRDALPEPLAVRTHVRYASCVARGGE